MIMIRLIRAISTILLPLYVIPKLAEYTSFSPSTCYMPVEKFTFCFLSVLMHSLFMGFCLSFDGHGTCPYSQRSLAALKKPD